VVFFNSFRPLSKVIVAHNQVLNWITAVVNEVKDYKKIYDITQSMVKMDLKVLSITTTASTTRITTVMHFRDKDEINLRCGILILQKQCATTKS
jgi:hypothetical protein